MQSRKPKGILLIAITLICALWASSASAYLTYTFSGTGVAADALGAFDVYDVNYLITVSPTAGTLYYNPDPVTGLPTVDHMTGTLNLTGGTNFADDTAANMNFTAAFDVPLYVAYDPSTQFIGFGESGAADFLSGPLNLNINLWTTLFGPTSIDPALVDAFASLFDGGTYDIELITNDVMAASIPSAPVPIPAAAWLLATGLGAIGIVRRKRA